MNDLENKTDEEILERLEHGYLSIFPRDELMIQVRNRLRERSNQVSQLKKIISEQSDMMDRMRMDLDSD